MSDQEDGEREKPWQVKALEYEGDDIYRNMSKHLLILRQGVTAPEAGPVRFTLSSAAGMIWELAAIKEKENAERDKTST